MNAAKQRSPISTEPEEQSPTSLARTKVLRRLGTALLCLLLLAAALGFLGVKTATAVQEGGGYRIEVTYGKIVRPGLAVPWQLEISKPGGFDGPITVAVNSSYFEMFDENGFSPDPSSSTSTADQEIWEFDPPDGETLLVSLDARIEPGVQWGKVGKASVLVEGVPAVTVSFKTWVVP